MQKKLLVAFIATSMLLFACGDSNNDGLPSASELSEALPTVTDMPDSWNETQRQLFDTREPGNPSIDPSVWCAEAKEESANLIELAGQSGADVEMQAETASGMPRMMRLQAWANDDVNTYFDAVLLSVQACDGITATDEFGAVSVFEKIDGKSIGDESVSWSQKTTPPTDTQGEKLESIGRTTVARFGSVIMVLQLGDAAMTGDAELMDEDAWWSIVELSAKGLKDL